MEWSSISHASKQFKYLIAQHMIRKSPLKRLTCISFGKLPIFGPHQITGKLIEKEFKNSSEGGKIFHPITLNIPGAKRECLVSKH